MLKKRRLNKLWPALILAGLICLGAGTTAMAAQSPQMILPGTSIPKFVNQLPLLSAAGGTIQTVGGNVLLTINMEKFDACVLPPGTPIADNLATAYLPATGSAGSPCPGAPLTKVFGYIEDAAPPPASGYGVRDTFTGPVILNARGPVSTDITYVNNLGDVTDPAAFLPDGITPNPVADPNALIWYRYAIDQTLHWADPLGVLLGTPEENYCFGQAKLGFYPAPTDDCAENYLGPVAAVPHLHGGEVPAELDGGPDAWFTSDGNHVGHAYYSADGVGLKNYAIYNYPTTQEAAPIWFHDHGLGITRLNVYAGLAGAYLIHDPAMTLPTGLHFAGLMNGAPDPSATDPTAPTTEYTVPLVIQDRMFDTEGQFFYQSDSAGGVLWATNPEHPYWTPEFLGDVILVNGKAWPNMNVEPKRYRFWIINGSNARTYEMFLTDPLNTGVVLPDLYVIATDGGYLDRAAPKTKKLVVMPGERYEVIIDFASAAGTNLILKNTAKSPYPAGAASPASGAGTIMQFTVGANDATGCPSGFCGGADLSYNPAPMTAPDIRSTNAIVPLPKTGYLADATNHEIRQLTLNEVLKPATIGTVTDPVTGLPLAYPGGPLEILVNNTPYGGLDHPGFSSLTTPIPSSTGSPSDTTWYSEIPKEGTTEMWEIVNLTADAHPIHLHLVQFQIINRQNFDIANYLIAYNGAFPGGTLDGVDYVAGVYMPGYGPPRNYAPIAENGWKWGGNPDVAGYLMMNKKKQFPVYPPLPQEAGWKDTVVAYPGQVTRIAVRWAPTDAPVTPYPNTLGFAFSPTSNDTFPHGWVWHCHIVDHEDNEMMRPFQVSDNPTPPSRTIVKGVDF